jgi:esterase/lipase superfamily enzyme
MGNRALIEALKELWWYPEPFHRTEVLKNVILAAADENLRKFEVMLREMNGDPVRCPLISVYSSACDWPLFLSGYINWKLRLGNTLSLFGHHSMRRCYYDMVDVIDASGVRCDSPLQHSYHAEAPEVLDDIQKLLTGQKRAGERPVIEPLRHNSGQVFHACVPSWWFKSKTFKRCIERIENQALPTRVTDGSE